ncbi:hypothetical protein AWZ03_015371 [Drosophila navojoa]|uniref:Uncharacterized protein n=1 Tax=Drosophila navojoa TaxID=7232 RepID=A0A484ALI8_DRONA|nr:hypothetical protein AWZ03_015371 [Drosophila navojoa]
MYLSFLKKKKHHNAEKLGLEERSRLHQANDQNNKPGIDESCLMWNSPHVVNPLAIPERFRKFVGKFWRGHSAITALLEDWPKISSEITRK